jgi:hypothetical protein
LLSASCCFWFTYSSTLKTEETCSSKTSIDYVALYCRRQNSTKCIVLKHPQFHLSSRNIICVCVCVCVCIYISYMLVVRIPLPHQFSCVKGCKWFLMGTDAIYLVPYLCFIKALPSVFRCHNCCYHQRYM